ncbi:MAG: TlpA family protein disulfide reductase [Candidatus Limnocylindria bacterium]
MTPAPSGRVLGSAGARRRVVALLIGAALVALGCAPPSASDDGSPPAPDGPTAGQRPAGGVARVLRKLEREGAAGRIGARAPDFEWVEPDGSIRRLSELEGRVVIVNFWATWCVPCRTEMPTFEQLAKTTPDVVFLMIDLQETPQAVRDFAKEHSLTHLRLIIDEDGSVSRAYGLFSLPQTTYVSAGGVIRHVDIGGPLEAERIRRGIAKAAAP